jgi:hypothetical protein
MTHLAFTNAGLFKNQDFSRQFFTAEARGVYMGFVVDKLALRQVSGFSYFSPLSFHHQTLIKVKFNLEQAMKAFRGSRGMALLFLNLGAVWG